MPTSVNPNTTNTSAAGGATPAQIQNWTVQYAQQYGVDPQVALQVLQQESSGGNTIGNGPTNRNGTYDTGPMQLNSGNFGGPGGTFPVTSGPGAGNYDPNDPQQNVQGGVAQLAALQQHYGGDSDAAIAAYNNGQGAVDHAMANFGDDYNAHLPNPSYQKSVLAQNPAPVNQNSSNIQAPLDQPLAMEDPTTPDVLNHTAVPYRELQLDPVSQDTLNALASPTVINTPAPNGVGGLDQTPWYNNPNELTGNPKIHAQGYPVTFQIITDRDTGAQLTDSKGNPISIRLNASMKSYNGQFGHIINKRPSRTGIHLTFWGMNADMISGECSTGLFNNQFGITSFLNMSNISSDAQALIQAAYRNNPNGTESLTSNPDALRIAAQDAFVEFLSLFKNNGVTWYHSQDYTSANGSNPDQASALTTGTQTTNYQSAYSPRTGLNTFQMKASNNDVFSRGYVVMNFRSSSYLGFFRSLSWTQDAKSPYRWNFNFVFQVERTLSLLYYPNPGANT